MTETMAAIFVTGANRGLGLEWVRQYADSGWRVYASCRHPSDATELQAIASDQPNVSIHRLDVTKRDEIHAIANELREASIDVLVNNAGIYLEKFVEEQIGRLDFGDFETTLRVNTLGAIRVTEALVEAVARSTLRIVVAITSHMGSISEIGSPGSYAYRSSKAALNATMKGLSIELKARNVGILLFHPGWVKTRMGGPGALYTPEESVLGMRRLLESFRMENSGKFFRFDGTEIPW